MRDILLARNRSRFHTKILTWLILLLFLTSCLNSHANLASKLSWTKPMSIVQGAGEVAISCVSPSFCAAGTDNGYLLTYNGMSWSKQLVADPNFVNTDILSISCSTNTFCEAMDARGNAYSYNGKSWSKSLNVLLTSGKISCPIRNFCVAVGGLTWRRSANETIFNGLTWTKAIKIDSGIFLVDVSCATTTFCVAIDSNGNEITYNGEKWSKPKNIDMNLGPLKLNAISCSSNIFCVVVDLTGNAIIYNGNSWSRPRKIDAVSLTSISCPNTNNCVSVDSNGRVLSYSSGSWESLNSTNFKFYRVSCSSRAFCIATNLSGTWAKLSS